MWGVHDPLPPAPMVAPPLCTSTRHPPRNIKMLSNAAVGEILDKCNVVFHLS